MFFNWAAESHSCVSTLGTVVSMQSGLLTIVTSGVLLTVFAAMFKLSTMSTCSFISALTLSMAKPLKLIPPTGILDVTLNIYSGSVPYFGWEG